MEPSIEQLVNSFSSLMEFKEISGIIVSILIITSFLLDKIYKYNNSSFYKIPGKYFKLNTFRDIVLYCFLSLIAIFALIYMFSEMFNDFYSVYLFNNNYFLFFYVFLALLASIIYFILIYIKTSYIDRAQKLYKAEKVVNNGDMIQKSLIYNFISALIILFIIFSFILKVVNVSIQDIIIFVFIATFVEAYLLIRQLFGNKNKKTIESTDRKCLISWIDVNYACYFTIISLMFFALMSSLLFSDKILNNLQVASKTYHESKVINTSKITDDNYEELSKYISSEIRNSNDWSYDTWSYRFNKPETIITSNCLGRTFVTELSEAGMKEPISSTIRLLLILNLMNSYITVLVAILACMCIIFIFCIVIKNNYFDPSKKKSYEYIKEIENKDEFIVSKYKDKILVLCGCINEKELVLQQDSYRLISPEDINKIYFKKFNNVTMREDIDNKSYGKIK